MLDWSKSFETYLNLSDKQRLGIGRKSDSILSNEIKNLVEEEFMRPSLYLMTLAPFISLKDEFAEKEYQFIREAINYTESFDKFKDLVNKGKNEKLAEFIEIYFQKVGGEVLTAYLSMGLALLTIKGSIEDNEKELIEKIHG